jgi:hypothetical protein
MRDGGLSPDLSISSVLIITIDYQFKVKVVNGDDGKVNKYKQNAAGIF